MEFKRARSDSITSAGSNGSAQRRVGVLDHHSMNAHRRPLEEFLTALRKVASICTPAWQTAAAFKLIWALALSPRVCCVKLTVGVVHGVTSNMSICLAV